MHSIGNSARRTMAANMPFSCRYEFNKALVFYVQTEPLFCWIEFIKSELINWTNFNRSVFTRFCQRIETSPFFFRLFQIKWSRLFLCAANRSKWRVPNENRWVDAKPLKNILKKSMKSRGKKMDGNREMKGKGNERTAHSHVTWHFGIFYIPGII